MTTHTSSGQDLSRILAEMWSSGNDEPVKKVFIKVLEVHEATDANVIDAISHFFLLIGDVREDVLNTFDTRRAEKFLTAIRKVEKTFLRGQLLDATWKQTSTLGAVTQETLDLIEECGNCLVDKTGGRVRLAAERLEKLRSDITQHITELLDADLDKLTKEALISGLRKLEEIIINYKIRGSSALEKASNEVAGKYFMMLWKGVSDVAKSHVDKALALVVGSIMMGALGTGFTALPEPVQHFLPEVRQALDERDGSDQKKDETSVNSKQNQLLGGE